MVRVGECGGHVDAAVGAEVANDVEIAVLLKIYVKGVVREVGSKGRTGGEVKISLP